MFKPEVAILPGETIETGFYIPHLSDTVTFDSHEPIIKPWVLLEAENDLIDVSAWDNIIVYNGGDDAATLSANTDDDNALVIPANAQQVFDNSNGLFGCLEVLTGTLSVWGSR